MDRSSVVDALEFNQIDVRPTLEILSEREWLHVDLRFLGKKVAAIVMMFDRP
jgi:hypothetical protein